jgi:hypothetical protein
MDVILPYLQNDFQFVKIHDEDIAIKHLDSEEWMRVKIKYYNTKCIINNPFIDFLIVLVNQNKEKSWVIPRKDALDVKNITIGKKTSKYDKFVIDIKDVGNNILKYFSIVRLFSYDEVLSKDIIVSITKPLQKPY